MKFPGPPNQSSCIRNEKRNKNGNSPCPGNAVVMYSTRRRIIADSSLYCPPTDYRSHQESTKHGCQKNDQACQHIIRGDLFFQGT